MPRQFRRFFSKRSASRLTRQSRVAIEKLEQRVALDGKVVAFFVAGGGGEAFPEATATYVDQLLSTLESKNHISEGSIYYTNWNSPNFDNPYVPSGNPSIITPNPVSDDRFVDALRGKLISEYDDSDTIILVGHSWGADSLVKVARRLEGSRQIDLLVLFDRVGSGGFRNSPGADPSLYVQPTNVKYLFSRWQTIVPFPLPVFNQLNEPGSLIATQDLVQRDFNIPGQVEQSYQKNADGSDDWHRASDFERLAGVELMFQNPLRPGDPYYAKLVDKDVKIENPLSPDDPLIITVPDGVKVRSLEHRYVPKDRFINAQLVQVLNGVIPQPPVIEATITPPGTVDEGTIVTIDATASYEPNVGQEIQGFEWSVNKEGMIPTQGSRVLQLPIGDNYDSLSPFGLGDPLKPLIVTLKMWDGPRGVAGTMESSRDFTISTRNVAPSSVVIQDPGRYVRGFEVPLTASFVDPGFLDTHTATWSVPGSSSAPEIVNDIALGARVATARPLYEAAGSYPVRVTIGDDDRESGQSGILTLNVDIAGLVPNPVDPSLRDLLVGGSTQGDVIRVKPGATPGSVIAVVNGTEYGPFDATGDIRIAGQAGDDRIEIGVGDLSKLIRPVIVDSGLGSDRIVLFDDGRTSAVDYLVTPTSVTVTNTVAAARIAAASAGGFGGLVYSGSTEFLDVLGTDGANIFDVQPSVDTRYFINGNLPAPGSVPAGEGDFLKLDTKTTFPNHPDGLDTSGRRLSMTGRGAGRWDFTAGTGHEPVEFESIERFNHVERIAVAPEAGRTSSPVVRVHDAETMAMLFEIPAAATYGVSYRHGVRVAIGDLDNDGIPDVVTSPGRMAAPVIKVFNGAPIPGLEGSEIAGLRLPAASTYGDGFKGGVNVAVGDVIGDRLNDIVITPDRGKAIVKVFRTRLVAGEPAPTNVKTASHSFDAFADFPRFIGGADVATADLLGNGRSRIVVGSGSGMDGLVRVFDVRSADSPYTATQTIFGIFERGLGGVQVAAGDIDGDGRDDLLMGSGPAGGTWLKARRGGTLSGELFQFQIASGRGSIVPTRVVLRDVNGDGRAEVFAAFGADARTGYRLVRLRNRQAGELDSLNVASAAFSGGGVNLG